VEEGGRGERNVDLRKFKKGGATQATVKNNDQGKLKQLRREGEGGKGKRICKDKKIHPKGKPQKTNNPAMISHGGEGGVTFLGGGGGASM